MKGLTCIIRIAYFLICITAFLALLVMFFIGSLLFWAVLIGVLVAAAW